MTQTLRRELRQKLFDALKASDLYELAVSNTILYEHGNADTELRRMNEQLLDLLADAALELRAFKIPTARVDRTDEEWNELNDKKMAALLPADQAEVEMVKHRDEIANLYESEMGYNPLQWWTDRKLIRLLKFLVKQTPEDIKTFAAWSKQPFSPLSPTQARKNPDLVAECWPQAFPTSKSENRPAATETELAQFMRNNQ